VNSERNDGPETYGGKAKEQADYAQRGLNYPGRFAPTQPDPKAAERQAEIDRVRG
jgi:hypothetical protein